MTEDLTPAAIDQAWIDTPGFVWQEENLVYRKGCFAVQHPVTGHYYFYKMKVEAPEGLFAKVSSLPPHLMDGFFCYESFIYRAPKTSLLKRKIYVSSTNRVDPHIRTSGLAEGTSTEGCKTSECSHVEMEEESSSALQYASGEVAWVEDSKFADLAFEGQIRELQNLPD